MNRERRIGGFRGLISTITETSLIGALAMPLLSYARKKD
jgi:hypothetical protein